MPVSPVIIEPAATLALLRDSASGPQVLMQQRSLDAAFVGGAWVFPGGKLDTSDKDDNWPRLTDLEPDRANRLLGVNDGGLAYWVAALRETVEEAGLLLASRNGRPVDSELARTAQQFLREHPDRFADFCHRNELTLQTSSLRYLSRWITPEGLPKRYDTRFFMAQAPADQAPLPCNHEVANTLWVTPEEALERQHRKEWFLVLPTQVTLQQLCGYTDVAQILKRLGNHIDPKSE